MASTKGQLTFNFALSVPADKAAEVEAMIATHAQWMRETHSLEADGKIHLVDYHVAKSEEEPKEESVEKKDSTEGDAAKSEGDDDKKKKEE